MFGCRGGRKGGKILGEGSSVLVAMTMAVPVTPGGEEGGEVKGRLPQPMVQLSSEATSSLKAAAVIPLVRRRERERETERAIRDRERERFSLQSEKEKNKSAYVSHVIHME